MINLTRVDVNNKKLRVITFKRILRNDNEHPLADSSIFTTDHNNEFVQLPNLDYVIHRFIFLIKILLF